MARRRDGAGKSTVGPALARRLCRRFIDTDAEIVRQAGRSIAEIFEGDGEPAFRDRERLARSETVVYLRARPQTLLTRLGDCRKRPLLRAASPAERLARLRALLEERREA